MTGMEWAPVVESALTALGAAAGAGAWTESRNGIVALFRRHGRDGAAVERQLTDDRGRLADGDAETVEAWRERLAELLTAEPGAVAGLNEWRNHSVQHITASAPNATAQGVIHGSIVNHYAPPSDR